MAFHTIVAPNGHILTSPNTDTLPLPSTGPSSIPQIPDNVSDYATVLWALPKYPYLPFISKTPVFSHYPLNRLAILVDTASLDRHPTKGWRFPEKDSRSWSSLQASLLHVGTTLLSWAKHAYPQRDLHATIPPLPETFGFTKFHQTAEEARKCLGHARDSFIVLIAFVSFAIAISNPSGDPSNPDAPWVRYMLETRKGHPSWYDGIRNSFITDFSETSRVGMIIKVSDCPPEHLVKRMMTCRIPVWFYWGLPPLPFTNHAIAAQYRPLLENRSGPPLSNTQPFKVERNSRQKPGETWREYFARRRIQTDQIKARESSRERSNRLNRERAQVKRQQPGKKGPTAWHWEDKGGYRVRTLLSRGEAGFIWSHYRNAQLKYDSFSNEYDICTEFGSDDEGGSRYDRGEEDDENMEGTPPYPMPPLQATGEPEALALTTAASDQLEQGPDVLTVGALSSSPPSLHTQEPEADPSTTATTGQLPKQSLPGPDISMVGVSSSSPRPSPHTQEPEADPPTTATTGQLPKQSLPGPDISMVGVSSSSPRPSPHTQEPEADPPTTATTDKLPVSAVHAPTLSESALDVLEGHLYTPLAHEEISTGDLSDLLYYRFGYIGSSTSRVDYSYRSRFNSWGLVCSSIGGHDLQCKESERSPIIYFLSMLLDSKVPLEVIPCDLWDLSPESIEPLAEVQPFIDIVDTKLNISTPYILRPRGLHPTRDCSWSVAVNALTALQCIRGSLGPHTVDIVSDLLSRGIPFRTFAPSQFTTPDFSPSFIVPAPPIRLHDYTFDLADYITYETRRDSFLRVPRCRAALQIGGIVWRLAQESLPNSAVLCGPSQDALNGCCEVVSYGEEKLCDDTLPDAALDLICGVYKIPTSYSGQFTEKSWWPKHNVWVSSGYSYGQWTNECENWFVKRLADIRSGKATAITSRQWRDGLRLTNTAPKLTRAMNKAAATYISGCI